MGNVLRVFLLFFVLLNSFWAFSQPGQKQFREAEQFIRNGDFEAAIVAYSEAIKLDSTSLNYILRRGFAFGLAGKYEEAIKDYSTILSSNPDHVFSLNGRGCAYNKLGDYEKALADFNKVLEIEPKNQEAFNNRGWVKKFLGDHDGACKDWNLSRKMGNEEAAIILKNNYCR